MEYKSLLKKIINISFITYIYLTKIKMEIFNCLSIKKKNTVHHMKTIVARTNLINK